MTTKTKTRTIADMRAIIGMHAEGMSDAEVRKAHAKLVAAKPRKATLATIIATLNTQAFAYAHAETASQAAAAALRATIKAIAEKDVKTAQRNFYAAYVGGKLAPNADTLTPAMLKAGEELCDMGGHDPEGTKTTKDGKARRSLSQETIYAAARKAWSRLSKKEDIKPADTRGGARRQEKPADKPKTKATINLVAKTAKDAAAVAHNFKAGWINFMSGVKELATPELLALGNDITIALNRYEKMVGELKPAAK